MCNCGNKRNERSSQSAAQRMAGMQPPLEKTGPAASFMYTGQSALTVTGTVTGKRYRFNAPGEQQLIDYRDAALMMPVPVLKRMP